MTRKDPTPMTPHVVCYSLFADVDGRNQYDGGQGVLGALFAGRFGAVPNLAQITNADPWFQRPQPAAVVVIPGQHHTDPRSVEWINEDLNRIGRAVVVVMGDEASTFPWEQVDHPALRWWMMTPRHRRHAHMPTGTRFLGEGPGPQVAVPRQPKNLDVAFMGQATHASRQRLVRVLERMDPSRVLCEPTGGFMQGRARADYLTQLARAKVAACPSGAQTVDSFRLYESLELGCVPVVERRTPDGHDHRMWDLCYPQGVPFPVVDDWAELPALLPGLLEGFETVSAMCRLWWTECKTELAGWLTDDIAWSCGTVDR